MTTPANPLKGEAALTVGSIAYKLAFDPNAFVYAEEAYGKQTHEIIEDLERSIGGVNMKLRRTLLWAALQRHHPCSQAEAGDIMGDAGMAATTDAVDACLRAALGVTEGKEQSDPPKPGKGGTG